ncbi:MAG: lipid-A-disaccharide synthase [Litorimonas sp.]
MTRPDVFLVSAEPSGDQLSISLIRSLRRKRSEVRLEAIGGTAIEAAGLSSQMSVDGLSVLGFVEGLKAYTHVLAKVREATDIILRSDPAMVVLIDSWGFMVRVAKRLKAKGYRGLIVKYVAPQVWAMRPGRAKVLARYVDHLLSIQPMDAPHFEAAMLPQTYVGNPVFDTDFTGGDGNAFRSRHGLDGTAPIIGFFFGSRPSEIDRVGPAIVATHQHLLTQWPDLQAVYVLADAVRDRSETLIDGVGAVRVGQDELLDALAALDGAVACSGTVTTQLASAGVPTVVLYELSPLTFFFASRLFVPRYISIVNIAADGPDHDLDAPLMPEFMQDEIHTAAPANALIEILKDEDSATGRRNALLTQTRRMGANVGSASDRAADAILTLLDQRAEIGT